MRNAIGTCPRCGTRLFLELEEGFYTFYCLNGCHREYIKVPFKLKARRVEAVKRGNIIGIAARRRRMMRQLYADGDNVNKIARLMGCSKTLVYEALAEKEERCPTI